MTTDLKRMVGRRIREARKRLGWTQEDLAERIERAVETVSNMERGHTIPTLDTLERVSRALGIPLKALFDMGEQEGSTQRHSLRLKLEGLLSELSDADFAVAVGLVQVLANARGVAGLPTPPLSESGRSTEVPKQDTVLRRPSGTFPPWEE